MGKAVSAERRFLLFDNGRTRKIQTHQRKPSAWLRNEAFGDTIKRERAHGGCLGTARRRRTWQAAKSLGERQTRIDPKMSEWSNPSGATPRHFRLNEIGRKSETRGSETSQYPEEKKTTVISQVAASEREEAQTRELAPWGCGTATRQEFSSGERFGKAGQRG